MMRRKVMDGAVIKIVGLDGLFAGDNVTKERALESLREQLVARFPMIKGRTGLEISYRYCCDKCGHYTHNPGIPCDCKDGE